MAQRITVQLQWPGKLTPAQLSAGSESTSFASVQHSSEVSANRLYHADNLVVLRHLYHQQPGQLDLVYIDPPFCAGRDFHTTRTAARRELAFTDRWEGGLAGYLSMMQQRLWLIHQLLTPHGSVYIHCDYRASAHLRLLMDEIFGPGNLRAEIIWHYQSGGRARSCYAMKHDTLLLYSRGSRWTFNADAISSPRGSQRRNHMKRQTDTDGRVFYSIKSAGKVYRYYEDELVAPPDVWCDISHLQQKDPERTGYATQKPLALLRRIILASSDRGQYVADFFCGSGTTAVAAALSDRHWIASDFSELAIRTTQQRLAAYPLLTATQHTLLHPEPARTVK